MRNLASQLDALPGVLGFAVFDAGFRCPTHRLPADLDAGSVMQALLQLQTAFDTFASAHGGIEHGSVITFVAECAHGSLALRRIGAYQIVTLLEAGSDPGPLVEALHLLSAELESETRDGGSIEDSLGNLISDEELDASSSLEYFSASLESPAEPDPAEPSAKDSIWTTDVREIVGKLGRKKDDE